MSQFDDYESEMKNDTFSDDQIERLLSGSAPSDHRLEELTAFVAMMRAEGTPIPHQESVTEFARVAAEIARAAAPEAIVQTLRGRTLSRARRFNMGMRRKLATALVAGVLLASMTGVAFAADGAAPGDPLYGLDIALERVGLGAGGLSERLREAGTLAAHDQPAAALEHATSVIAQVDADEEASAEALAGLEAAIAELNSIEDGSEHAVEVRSNVATMLQWMIDNADLVGEGGEPGAFGKGVAELAGQISTEDDAEDAAEDAAEQAAEADEDDDGDGPPEGVPTGPPAGIPPARP